MISSSGLLIQRIARLIVALRRHRNTKRAAYELNQLDDFMLLDIGISRSDIEWFVRKGRCDHLA